jgi:uncharacterized protein YjbI with pentapeptide repeats
MTLIRANLGEANFDEADLKKAVLSGADLRNASLQKTCLRTLDAFAHRDTTEASAEACQSCHR